MSLAAFRKSEHDDLVKLAEEHLKHDLNQSDRDALTKASSRVTMPTAVGTIIGLGLGVYAAVRLRRLRAEMFGAFRAAEKPTHVIFANGPPRYKPCPTLRPCYARAGSGDFATYFFFGLGGTILGGELGLLLGSWSASRVIGKDPERRKRVETAYRRFRADYLRKEADRVESGQTPSAF
ncbi:hypothetical protein F4780DRAFT_774090 [Xylariomycetidae sp. FL0641]|nr:hypothetical protein F4780DRAFT_774090 [Xylariomycetidae sp. FL0641]